MRRVAFFIRFVGSLGALAMLWDCAPKDPSEAVQTPVPSSPRIVCLAPSLADILGEIGASDRVVGVCQPSGSRGAAPGPPVVATLGGVDVERILALRPTCCLTVTGMQSADTLQTLRRLGIEVVEYPMGSLAHLWACIEDAGARAGSPDPGRRLAENLRARVDSVRRGSREGVVEAVVIVGTDPLVVVGRESFLDDILAASGYRNALAQSQKGYPSVSLETLALARPRCLVYPLGDLPEREIDRVAREIGALTGAPPFLLGVEADHLVRPGPGSVLAVEELAAKRPP